MSISSHSQSGAQSRRQEGSPLNTCRAHCRLIWFPSKPNKRDPITTPDQNASPGRKFIALNSCPEVPGTACSLYWALKLEWADQIPKNTEEPCQANSWVKRTTDVTKRYCKTHTLITLWCPWQLHQSRLVSVRTVRDPFVWIKLSFLKA